MKRVSWRRHLLRFFNYNRRIIRLKRQSKDYQRQVQHLEDNIAAVVRQMNDASLAFLDQLRASSPSPPESSLALAKVNVAIQTDPDWSTHLVEELRVANARRFKAEALLYSANLPLIRADFLG